MLYKQIIMTQSIPFPISIPSLPLARDDMHSVTFDAIMQTGLNEAKTDLSSEAKEVFAELRREIP
jgi:hypothetical protein